MRAIVRRLLPVRVRRVLRAVPYIGFRFYCPCCGWRFRRLKQHGVIVRVNAKCPRCGSLERHRVLWRYLGERLHLPARPTVLHIAPEPVLAGYFRSVAAPYIAGDLVSPLANVRLDLTALPLRNDSVDAICCVHVLEHVEADELAMRELVRVLRPGCWAILTTPFDHAREHSYEDTSLTSPRDRERAFGQEDHVRIYGRDLFERLRRAGFNVIADDFVRTLPRELVERERMESCEVIVGWNK